MLADGEIPDTLRNEVCRDLVEARLAVERAIRKLDGESRAVKDKGALVELDMIDDDLWRVQRELMRLAVWVFPADEPG